MYTRKKNPTLSLLLNVYNEEENVEKVYREVKKVLDNAKILYELLFIEGGSTDNSYNVLLHIKKKDINCKVLKTDKGPGDKLRAGFKLARGKYIGFMCSDGQDNPSILPNAIKLLEKKQADFVKGERVSRSTSLIRFTISWCYNVFTHLLFGVSSKDINGHPKIFPREIIKKINLKSKNESIDLEIMLKVHYLGYKIVDLPILERNRNVGKSSVGIQVMFQFILDILSYKFGRKSKELTKIKSLSYA